MAVGCHFCERGDQGRAVGRGAEEALQHPPSLWVHVVGGIAQVPSHFCAFSSPFILPLSSLSNDLDIKCPFEKSLFFHYRQLWSVA